MNVLYESGPDLSTFHARGDEKAVLGIEDELPGTDQGSNLARRVALHPSPMGLVIGVRGGGVDQCLLKVAVGDDGQHV